MKTKNTEKEIKDYIKNFCGGYCDIIIEELDNFYRAGMFMSIEDVRIAASELYFLFDEGDECGEYGSSDKYGMEKDIVLEILRDLSEEEKKERFAFWKEEMFDYESYLD